MTKRCVVILVVIVLLCFTAYYFIPKGTFSDPAVQRLASAAEKGDVETIERLVREGVDPNARGSNNVTPLLIAFFARNRDGFEALLRAGADTNLLDDRGRAVMNEAAFEAESYWLEQALKHGGNPNLPNSGGRRTSGVTPIFYAIDGGSIKNAKLLIDAGADINHMEGGGNNVLLYACMPPRYQFVYLLLQSGADFRKKNVIGKDLLDWISSRNEDDLIGEEEKLWFRKTVELLRSKGVKLKLHGEGK